jgi:outer membrane protein assembly factor BamB
VFSPPAVADGIVFIASCQGTLYALEETGGALLWSYDIQQLGSSVEFHGSPLIDGDLILYGVDRRKEKGLGFVLAWDRVSGELRWQAPMGRGATTDVVRVTPNAVVVATLQEEVVCLDPQSGVRRWSYETGHDNPKFFTTPTPAVERGRVVFGDILGSVHAIDGETGERQWKTSVGKRVSTSVVVGPEGVLVGTADAEAVRLDPKSGAVLTRRTLPDASYGEPFLAGEKVVFLTRGDRVICLDTRLDRELWSFQLDSEIGTYETLLLDSHLFMGTFDGELLAVELESGRLSWTMRLTGKLRSVARWRGGLLVGTMEGKVYAVKRPK